MAIPQEILEGLVPSVQRKVSKMAQRELMVTSLYATEDLEFSSRVWGFC